MITKAHLHDGRTRLKAVMVAFLVACAFLPYRAGAVTVGPVKLEYTVDPGAVVTGEMFIKNEEKEARTFYPSIDEFTEQNGEKVFLKESGLIAEWLGTEKSVTLNPDESTKVPFTIKIPQNAPPGGQFAVVWWSTTPPVQDEEAKEVSIQTRAGILVYINVSGDITESAKVSRFGTENGKTVFGKALVPFTLTLSNEGNVYIKPKGDIKITSIFGHTVADVPFNAKGLQILPKSYRTFTDMKWAGSMFTFGLYKAEAKVLYGSKDQELTVSKWIWVFPVRLILIVVGIVIALAIILTIFFKLYNRWLIKKFAQNGK